MRTATPRRLTGLGFALALATAACFGPDQPDCTFRCGDAVANGNHCPENYTCNRDDGYCHRNGHTGQCPFGDLATAAPADLTVAVPADLTLLGDLTAPADMAAAPDAAATDGPTTD